MPFQTSPCPLSAYKEYTFQKTHHKERVPCNRNTSTTQHSDPRTYTKTKTDDAQHTDQRGKSCNAKPQNSKPTRWKLRDGGKAACYSTLRCQQTDLLMLSERRCFQGHNKHTEKERKEKTASTTWTDARQTLQTEKRVRPAAESYGSAWLEFGSLSGGCEGERGKLRRWRSKGEQEKEDRWGVRVWGEVKLGTSAS